MKKNYQKDYKARELESGMVRFDRLVPAWCVEELQKLVEQRRKEHREGKK